MARIESDVAELRKEMKAANDAIADVKNAVIALDGRITALDAKVDGRFSAMDAKIDSRVSALETKLIKWFIGTMLACTGIAIAVAKAIP